MSFSNSRSSVDRRTTSNDSAPGPQKAAPQQKQGGSGPHKRTASGNQRTSKNVEERRTERVQVTTRETLTSRTRSPERRTAPQAHQEKGKANENVKTSFDYGPRPSKGEMPQGSLEPLGYLEKIILMRETQYHGIPKLHSYPIRLLLLPHEYPSLPWPQRPQNLCSRGRSMRCRWIFKKRH